MKNGFTIIFLLFFCWLSVNAQVPHLEGKMFLDLKKGYLSGDVTITNLPELGSNYRIHLNRGINIKSVKVDSISLFYQYWNVPTEGYAAEYALLYNEQDTVRSPRILKVNYVGAFPVYQQEYNAFDDAGIIAHNGKTFRAKPQSAWYPLLKDLRSGEIISDYTYNIEVECPDCKEIYVNGSAPQKGKVGKFISDSPKGLMLFAGEFSSVEREDAYFVNTTLSQAEMALFSRLLGQIKEFYEKKLGINSTDKPVLLQHTSIEKFSPNRSWGSVVYPTFTVAGQDFKNYLALPKQDFSSWGYHAFFSHELAHFYFGNLFRSKGPLQHLLGESIPEYLSMKSVAHKYGPDTLQRMIQDKIYSLKEYQKKNKPHLPLAKLNNAEQVNSNYRYQLGPLLLLYIEQTIGEEKLLKVFKLILKDKFVAQADYSYLKSKFLQAGISKSVIDTFDKRLFNNASYLVELEEKLNKLKK